jgi:hypothetical protein
MNAEHMHQLYGGEIGDYLIPTKILSKENVSNFDPTGDITNIYTSQVQNKGAINTKGLVGPNINLTSLIDQKPPDPMQQMLNQTLTKLAQEHGFEDEPGIDPRKTPDLVLPKEQKLSDIQQAQDSIMAAIAELKAMGAA